MVTDAMEYLKDLSALADFLKTNDLAEFRTVEIKTSSTSAVLYTHARFVDVWVKTEYSDKSSKTYPEDFTVEQVLTAISEVTAAESIYYDGYNDPACNKGEAYLVIEVPA